MKKTIAMILVLMMLACILSGCQKKPAELEPVENVVEQQPVVPENQEQESEDPKTEDAETEAPAEQMEYTDPYEAKICPYYSDNTTIGITYFNDDDGQWYLKKEDSTTQYELTPQDMAELIRKTDIMMQLHCNEAADDYNPEVPAFIESGFVPSPNPGILVGGQILSVGVTDECVLMSIVANIEVPSLQNTFTEYEITKWIRRNNEWIMTGPVEATSIIAYAEDIRFEVDQETGLAVYDLKAENALEKEIPCKGFMNAAEE